MITKFMETAGIPLLIIFAAMSAVNSYGGHLHVNALFGGGLAYIGLWMYYAFLDWSYRMDS